MELIYLPRQEGKTTLMLTWVEYDPNRILLTFSHNEAMRLKKLRPDLKDRIMSYSAWKNDKKYLLPAYRNVVIGIDNVDLVLQDMLGNVRRITMSTPEGR